MNPASLPGHNHNLPVHLQRAAGKGQPGWTIADESFAVKHDDVGLVGMANCGEPHTAATQVSCECVDMMYNNCSMQYRPACGGTKGRKSMGCWNGVWCCVQ